MWYFSIKSVRDIETNMILIRKTKEKVRSDRNTEENEPSQVKVFMRRSRIDIERCSTETIKMPIYNVKNLIKKVEKLPKGDIRRLMES